MAKSSQIARVGRRKVELTNLDKILYPDDHVVKAELIDYYLKIAPTILSHVKGRPLSLVRYPDGIAGERFFQKNRPEWAPDWIEYVPLGGEDKKDYILATEEASMVWLANLACIELHQIHSHKPHYDKPDYFVFDLDPPDECPFADVARIAIELRDHLEGFGYCPFVKTTGRKGLHVVVPVEPKWSFDEVFAAAKGIAKPFVETHSDTTTLRIKKEAREEKVLIDIYRNRPSQTIVSPYSVRGLPGAPVSMPLGWDELATLKDSRVHNIRSVPERVISEGDRWAGIAAYATELHTQRVRTRRAQRKLEGSRKRKTPQQLERYAAKRSFERTPEPTPYDLGTGQAFVVHRHHASRLHYDLRLERDGVLKSWAVPRGLPPCPGIKRLAVQTEDHPIEYLGFDGTIPKGEYGGGRMWIFAKGRYEITKEKKNGFYFRLQSPEVTAEYRMYETGDRNWMLERVDNPQVNYLSDAVEFMLSQSSREPPASHEYLFEVKWDGIRAMVTLDEGDIRIRSRNQRDITDLFPELLVPEQAFRVASGLFDAEIVCLDEDGKPNFKHVINRIQQSTTRSVERAKVRHPAACYVFDCLYLDGRPLVHEPLQKRREWMTDSIREGSRYRVSEAVDNGVELFAAAKAAGLEGIMAKERQSRYMPGKRTTQWLKIKSRHTIESVIIGYTKGRGSRSGTFGALHIARYDGDELRYLGKVGSGFDDRLLRNVLTDLKKVKQAKRPVKEKPLDDAQTTWLEPKLVCEVEFASFTGEGTLREPVFVRLRPDLDPFF